MFMIVHDLVGDEVIINSDQITCCRSIANDEKRPTAKSEIHFSSGKAIAVQQNMTELQIAFKELAIKTSEQA